MVMKLCYCNVFSFRGGVTIWLLLELCVKKLNLLVAEDIARQWSSDDLSMESTVGSRAAGRKLYRAPGDTVGALTEWVS